MKAKYADPEYRRLASIRHKNRIQNNRNKIPFSITNGTETYGPFKLQKDAYGKVPIGTCALNWLFTGKRDEMKGYKLFKHK